MLKKSMLDRNKIPQFSFNWRASAVLHSMNRLREDQLGRNQPAINEKEFEFNSDSIDSPNYISGSLQRNIEKYDKIYVNEPHSGFK